MTRLTKAEKETIFLSSEADADYEVYTFNKALKAKLEKLSEQYPDIYVFKEDNGDGGVTYLVPKRYVKINAPRSVSEEQKETLKNNLKKSK